MKAVLYCLAQCSWGVLQTALGLFNFILHIRDRHYFYHGAVITEWNNNASVSLGMFVFVTKRPYFCELRNEYTVEKISHRLVVHEYGHTIQSLILGPLYLIIIGIPSAMWANLPCCAEKRRAKGISYFSFFTESWANSLGERVTKQKSMERLIID